MSKIIQGKSTRDIKRHLAELETDTVLICIDNQVAELYPETAHFSFKDKNAIVYTPEGPPKDFKAYGKYMEYVLSQDVHPKAHLVAIGGGALIDMAGFAASTLFRGIPWSTIPTTLTAMVDAGIGGKTAVDVGGYKNAAGTFHPPERVFIYTDFLRTLPESERTSGLGEVVKYCFLDRNIFDLVMGDSQREKIIFSCARYKQKIVRCDPKDTGKRRILNLGHTLGHAFEKIYNISHGQAVLEGMRAIFHLTEKTHLLDTMDILLKKLSIPNIPPPWQGKRFPVESVLDHLKRDKKRRRSGVATIVECEDVGRVHIREVILDKFAEKLRHFNQKKTGKSLYFTSLGCSKNLVDSQVMLGFLGLEGFSIHPSPEEAEVIIINTCSFIEASKKESVDTILEMAEHKKRNCNVLVVSGCMAQRYSERLEREFPEVDLIIGTGEYHRIAKLLKAHEEGALAVKSHVEVPKFIHTEYDPRINTSPFYSAWLKVSEGCNRNCTFCIIPTLRGTLRSRSIASLVQESQNLVSEGVREINVVSQDLSDYGSDLSSDDLAGLLKGLGRLVDLDWVRLFYFYPDELSDKTIEAMALSPNLCRYLDSPVQHFSDSILRRMNRRITGVEIIRRIEKLRAAIPDIVLRTSVIVGFPGETEEDFEHLLEGIRRVRFHHLGIFRYSDEEGTPAFRLRDKIDPAIIEERFDRVYELQREIASQLNQGFVGHTLDVLIEGLHEESDRLVVGRHQGQAPDVDGRVIINDLAGLNPHIGDMIKVEVTEALGFDVLGRAI